MVAQLSIARLGDLCTPLIDDGVVDRATAEAIERAAARLSRALDQDDRELAVGCCKDLTECVAKVVLEALGRAFSPRTTLPTLVNSAHAALDRLPGTGSVGDGLSMKLAQQARAIAVTMAEVRNGVGTGHGRTTVPVVPDDLLSIACSGSVGWCAWALERLKISYGTSAVALMRQLNKGVFTQGVLAQRIVEVDMSSLPVELTYDLGMAVAARAMRETFVVRFEGVHACAVSADLDRWPEAYRRGLVRGLLLNSDDQLEPDVWSIERVADLLGKGHVPVVKEFMTAGDKGIKVGWGPTFYLDERRVSVGVSMADLRPSVPPHALTNWQRIENSLIGFRQSSVSMGAT